MQIETKELEPCKFMVSIVGDTNDFKEKEVEVLDAFKKAPVPGNRPGKAKLSTIKTFYKKQIHDSMKQALAEDAYHKAVSEKNFKPVGNPFFSNCELDGENFKCEFLLHTVPDFELKQYKELEIPSPHMPMSNADMAAQLLQNVRIQNASVLPYDENDVVEVGDNVIVDYEGSLDGVKVENISSEGAMFTVGATQLSDFDQNLLGMKAGETKTFPIKMPDEAPKELAGKTAEFKLTVTTGSKVVPAAVDDELAKKVNRKDVADLMNSVNELAMGKLNMQLTQKKLEAVSLKLIADHDFAVPNFLVLSEAESLAAQSQKVWADLLDSEREPFITAAEKQVKLSLILNKIRENEPEIQMTDQEALKMIRDQFQQTNPELKFDDMLKNKQTVYYIQYLVAKIKDEYALDFLQKSTKFVD